MKARNEMIGLIEDYYSAGCVRDDATDEALSALVDVLREHGDRDYVSPIAAEAYAATEPAVLREWSA